MATAHEIPNLACQPRQSAGPRLLRRFGGIVRNAIASVARRSVAPQPAARNADARPTPGRTPRARPARSAPPASSAPSTRRPGWLPRLLCRRPSRSSPHANPFFLLDQDQPFTPESFPGLDPEFCALLNTPLEDCDPETLTVLCAAFAETLAHFLPQDSGMDARALFSAMRGRLGATLDDSLPEAPPAAPPPVPAQAFAPAPATAPIVASIRVPPAISPQAQAAPPPNPALPAATPQTAKGIAPLPGPIFLPAHSVSSRGISLRPTIRHAVRPTRRRQSLARQFQKRPPARQCAYAARASPA